MGRRFTSGAGDRISSSTTLDLAGLNWLFGTQAVLMTRMVDTGGIEQMVVTNDSGGTNNQWSVDAADLMDVWDTGATTFAGAVPVGVPMLLGWTKTAGTVTPRGHTYRFGTNVWAHTAGSATVADSGPMTSLIFGSGNIAGGQPLDAEVWAIGLWRRNMTDKEFERLSAGNWLNSAPDFYEQWTDGREATVMKSTLGKFPTRQTAMVGTTRGVQKPPPGFRMCVQRRRR